MPHIAGSDGDGEVSEGREWGGRRTICLSGRRGSSLEMEMEMEMGREQGRDRESLSSPFWVEGGPNKSKAAPDND